jgi:hypothetical protein
MTMIYAQFFQHSAIDKSKLIEACGDRAAIILDGRNTTDTHKHIAAHECKNRGFVAYQLHKGDSFTRSNPISQIFKVD